MKYARRFGCLCFVKIQPVPPKPSPRALPGVFLGVSRNASKTVEPVGSCGEPWRKNCKRDTFAGTVATALSHSTSIGGMVECWGGYCHFQEMDKPVE